MMDEFSRWKAALAGQKLDMGDRDDPPSGYFRRSAGNGRWEAIAVYRDNGVIQCCRNMFGDGSNMTAGEIDELFAGDVYAVPYDVYAAVEAGDDWPPEYKTRVKTSDAKAGVVWTLEYAKGMLERDQMIAEGRAKAEAAPPENGRAVAGDNSEKMKPHELIKARISDLKDDCSKYLREIGGQVTTQAHADKLATFAAAFAALKSEAEGTREALKKPHLIAGREIDAAWKPVVGMADDEARASKATMTAFLTAQEEAAREASRKAAEASRIAAEAERQSTSAQTDAPVPTIEPAKVKAGYGRGVALRDVSRPVIEDLVKVAGFLATMNTPPIDFIEACKTAARKMMQAGVAVPGAKMVTTREAA